MYLSVALGYLVQLCASHLFDTPAVHQLTEPVDHGEGPVWDYRTGLLYFVDIFKGGILSYSYVKNELNEIRMHGNTTLIIPSLKDPQLFIVGVDRSLYAIKWDGSGPIDDQKNLTTVSRQFPTSRINDGKADPMGRVWFGTMGHEGPAGIALNEGFLYFVSRDSLDHPLPIIHPVNISNGLAWNKAFTKFYYIDTPSFAVREYDYNNYDGVIANGRVVFNLTKHNELTGLPDGMTIDEHDHLWIALYNGGAVIKVDPASGCVLQVVAIPAQCVTSLAWGGPQLDVLFVTTSRHSLNESQRLMQPAAGSLFAITNLNTNGLPVFFADIIDTIDGKF